MIQLALRSSIQTDPPVGSTRSTRIDGSATAVTSARGRPGTRRSRRRRGAPAPNGDPSRQSTGGAALGLAPWRSLAQPRDGHSFGGTPGCRTCRRCPACASTSATMSPRSGGAAASFSIRRTRRCRSGHSPGRVAWQWRATCSIIPTRSPGGGSWTSPRVPALCAIVAARLGAASVHAVDVDPSRRRPSI